MHQKLSLFLSRILTVLPQNKRVFVIGTLTLFIIIRCGAISEARQLTGRIGTHRTKSTPTLMCYSSSKRLQNLNRQVTLQDGHAPEVSRLFRQQIFPNMRRKFRRLLPCLCYTVVLLRMRYRQDEISLNGTESWKLGTMMLMQSTNSLPPNW